MALLALAICLLHCAGNSSLPLVDRDEPRFAEATREMVQGGDWVVPHFNGGYRFDKPPLVYWMQAASMRVFGGNEFAVRFPSALCAALTALVLLLWGARWRGVATGERAALVFSLCVQVFQHGRGAVADMTMVLCFTVAAWCAWLLGQESRRVRWAGACFWVALGLGFLAKGPVAWLPLVALPWAPKEARRALLGPWWKPVLGVVVMLGMVAAWGVPALLRTGGEFAAVGLGKHVVARSVGVMEGHGLRGVAGYLAGLPFYFVAVFVSLFPWSFWLPGVAGKWWRRDRFDPTACYLGAVVLVVFGAFTLVSTKLIHYTLPALPALALLMASAWPARGASSAPDGGAFMGGKALGGDRMFERVALGWAVFVAVIALVLFPLAARHTPSEVLWARIKDRLTADTAVATLRFQEPSLVWTLRRRVAGYLEILSKGDAVRWIAQPGPRLLVCEEAEVAGIFGAGTPQGVEALPVEGFQIARGRRVRLVVLWKPGQRASVGD